MVCSEDAAFSKRIGASKEVEVIGGRGTNKIDIAKKSRHV
jgi:hypothetical protein